MKRKALIVFLASSFVMMGTGALYAQKPMATVTPSPLEVYGDSIRFTATVKVPAQKVLKKSGTYVIKPELGDYKWPHIKIPYNQLGDPGRNGINYTFTVSAPFDEDMIGNDLEIEHDYEVNGASDKDFADLDDKAECCITTGRLFVNNSQYTMQKYTYTPGNSEPLKIVAQFNFPVDISTLGKDVYSKELTAIGTYLKKYPDSKIVVRGYASPEGPYERNITLSQERAAQAKQWLVSQLQKSGYSKYVKPANITVETTTEDWEGFKAKLAESDLPKATQRKVADAISSGKTPAEIETEVIALLGGKEAAEPYLRPLRRSTVVVASPTANRAGMTQAQIDSVVNIYGNDYISASAMTDIFNDEEYLAASQATKAPTGKMTLLMAYYKKNPGDYRAISDLGVMSLVDVSKVDIVGGDDAIVGVGFNRDEWDIDGEVDIDDNKLKVKSKVKLEDSNAPKVKEKLKVDFKDGESLLLRAYSLNSKDPVVLNNLGAFYIAEGDLVKARDYLLQSQKISNNAGVNYNLGLYYANVGDFKKALEHFNKAEGVRGMLYNRALAKVMLRDHAGAKADLTKFLAENPDHMLANYVMAIVGARTNDVGLASRHIKKAIATSSNKKLSDAVKEDLEFRFLVENETFKKAADDDPKN